MDKYTLEDKVPVLMITKNQARSGKTEMYTKMGIVSLILVSGGWIWVGRNRHWNPEFNTQFHKCRDNWVQLQGECGYRKQGRKVSLHKAEKPSLPGVETRWSRTESRTGIFPCTSTLQCAAFCFGWVSRRHNTWYYAVKINFICIIKLLMPIKPSRLSVMRSESD